MKKVGVILGSDSDMPKVSGCFDILEEFGIEFETIISSAHRTPDETVKWASTAEERGLGAIIAVAGGAAHLPGVVASHTIVPVIGVPVRTDIAGGLDSILSIIQMPSGVPVGAMPAGKSGGTNAALFAIEILAVQDRALSEKLRAFRKKLSEEIDRKNEMLLEKGFRNYIAHLEEKK